MTSHPEIVLKDPVEKVWHHYRDLQEVISANTLNEVLPALEHIERSVSENGLFAAGFMCYEAAPAFDAALTVQGDLLQCPLLWFGLFREIQNFNRPSLNSDKKAASEKRSGADLSATISQQEYSSCCHKIKKYIKQGHTYQINYTFPLYCQIADPKELVYLVDAPYSGIIRTGDMSLYSMSPELFFTLKGDHLLSRPMKGTASRGRFQEEDEKRTAELLRSEKDRAENLMITDMVRNDMGRIAEVGSVTVPKIFEIEKYPTLLQMTSTVESRTSANLADIFKALFPCASITGAPKVRSMKIIKEIEKFPRGPYTGTIGFYHPGRKAQFNVAIRTLYQLQDSGKTTTGKQKKQHYHVGSGIVWDSDHSMEFDECILKASILKSPETNEEFSLFESMLLNSMNEEIWLLDYHIKRLQASADYFSFPFDINIIENVLSETIKDLGSAEKFYKIKLILDKNGAPKVEAHELPNAVPQQRIKNEDRQLPWTDRVAPISSWKVALSENPVDSSNIFLFHKTTKRSFYDQRMVPGYDDTILINEKGEITESCRANVVVVKKGRGLTPPRTSGLLAGTYRQCLLDRNQLEEQPLRISDLYNSDSVFLINSVRGYVPVQMPPL